VIPKGEYGAGSVIVWDAGTYRNLGEKDGKKLPVAKQLDRGHLSIWLHGKKLQGGYSLTRVAKGKKGRWLLVKRKDDEADARRKPVKTEPESIRSGRTVEEVAAESKQKRGGSKKRGSEKPKSKKKR